MPSLTALGEYLTAGSHGSLMFGAGGRLDRIGFEHAESGGQKTVAQDSAGAEAAPDTARRRFPRLQLQHVALDAIGGELPGLREALLLELALDLRGTRPNIRRNGRCRRSREVAAFTPDRDCGTRSLT